MKKSIQFMRFSLVSLMICAIYFNALHSTRSVDLLGCYSSAAPAVVAKKPTLPVESVSSEQKPSKAPLTMMSLLLHKYPIGLSTVDAYNRYKKKEACDQKARQNQLRITYQPEKLLKQEESFHAISDQSWCSVDVLDVNRENNRSTLPLEFSGPVDETGSSDQSDAKIKVWNDWLGKNSQRVSHGKQVFNSLSDSNSSRRRSIEDVRSFVWFLFSKAVGSNKGFSEGTYVFHGDSTKVEKVYNFLDAAPSPVGCVGYGMQAACRLEGKQRLSSHFPEWNTDHYGIDVSDLPGGKRHLLYSSPIFMSNGKSKMYLKPEDYGVSTVSDSTLHGLQYVGIGKDADGVHRKEHVSESVTNAWLNYASSLRLTNNEQEQGLRNGIWKMDELIKAAEQAKQKIEEPTKQKKAWQEAKKKYDKKDIHARKGNEVLIEL